VIYHLIEVIEVIEIQDVWYVVDSNFGMAPAYRVLPASSSYTHGFITTYSPTSLNTCMIDRRDG
jgi:hypothetical protein